MVFLIQNTQNRDAKAIHLKLDKLQKERGERGRPVRPSVTGLRKRALEVGQDLALELVERRAECLLEVLARTLIRPERPEVVHHAREAVPLDEVIRHQE